MLAELASDLVEDFPEFAIKSDDVLMALAKTFPSGLDHWQTLIYPCTFRKYWKWFCSPTLK